MSAFSPTRRGLLMVVAASACWGAGTTLSDYALTGVTALQLLLVELGVATALVWIVALVGARGQLATPRWRLFVVLGIVEPALVFLFANLALAHESAATAALLFGIESVFTAVLAVLVLRERISRTLAAALMLGTLGTLAVGAAGEPGRDTLLGTSLALGAALCAGVYGVLARRWANSAPPLVITAYQMTAALVVVAPLVLVTGGASGGAQGDASHWLAAAATGVIGGALPFLLFNTGIAHVRASVAAVLLSCIPVVGVATAVAFRGDRPTLLQLVGGALALTAVVWIGLAEARAEEQHEPEHESVQLERVALPSRAEA